MSVSSPETSTTDTQLVEALGGGIEDSAGNLEESHTENDKNKRIEQLLEQELEGTTISNDPVVSTRTNKPYNTPAADPFQAVTGFTQQQAYDNANMEAQKVSYDTQLIEDSYNQGNLTPQQYQAYQQDLTVRRIQLKEAWLNIELANRDLQQQQQQQFRQNQEILYDMHPELRNDSYRAKAVNGCINRLRMQGYDDMEISGVTDPRLMSLLYQDWKALQKKPDRPFTGKLPRRRKKKSGRMTKEKFNQLGRSSQDQYLDKLLAS